ncbi:MAG: c-type cytochrome [Candidatus Melainabacteria bacterium]|nr:c-type cytochrome [Candidatus Melainabacteria bacterium]
MERKMIVGLALVVAVIVPAASIAQTSKKAGVRPKNESAESSKTAKTPKDKSVMRGRKLFGTHCASCHAAGGNSIMPGRPVKGSQVLSTLATFKSYLNEPVGNMPHYEHLIKDEKLLGDLYAYVKQLDQSDAPKEIDKSKDVKKRT